MLKPTRELPSRTVHLHGIPVHALTEEETCDEILKGINDGRGGFVITANLDHLLRSKRKESYRDVMSHADVIVADGMPLVWASRLKGTPLPQRVAGSTMCWSLSRELGNLGKSLYLLGGNPGVAERAARILEEKCPGLRVVGTHCPDFGFEKDPNQIAVIREKLIAAQPDMVYVALGSPKQEELIARLRNDLPKAWWMGVGISLSFITGDVQRAPLWMQNCGMEWMHRLSQEPKRLASRYLMAGIPFAIELLAVSGWQGLRGTK